MELGEADRWREKMNYYKLCTKYNANGNTRGWIDYDVGFFEENFFHVSRMLTDWRDDRSFTYKGSGKPLDIMVAVSTCVFISHKLMTHLQEHLKDQFEVLPINLEGPGSYYIFRPLVSVKLLESEYPERRLEPVNYRFAETPPDCFLAQIGKGILSPHLEGTFVPAIFVNDRMKKILQDFRDVAFKQVVGTPENPITKPAEKNVDALTSARFDLSHLPTNYGELVARLRGTAVPATCFLVGEDLEIYNQALIDHGCGESAWPEELTAVGHDGSGNAFYWDGERFGFFDHENDITTTIGNFTELQEWLKRVYN